MRRVAPWPAALLLLASACGCARASHAPESLAAPIGTAESAGLEGEAVAPVGEPEGSSDIAGGPTSPDEAPAMGATGGSGSPRTETPPGLDELRATHPAEGEGRDCTTDSDCDSPLRCRAGACAWPPAMTGEVDDSTPIVIFETPDGARPYYLETAVTQREQQRGLMDRHVLLPRFGMIFIDEEEAPQSFWMRNTLIPLDMVFIGDDGLVVSVTEEAEPLTLTARQSSGPARYVIELNGGDARRVGIAPGTRVQLLNLPEEQMPRGRR